MTVAVADPAKRAPSPPESRRRILVADDDAAIRSMLVELLKDEGYATLEAKSGNEVLRLVPVEEPDLLLMDLRMPEQDGIQIMRRLKTQDISVNNIIMMTAFGTSSAAIEAMHLGAYDYITKPFDLDKVLFTIQRYFEQQRLSRELARSRTEGKALSERIVGNTPEMQQVYKLIGQVAGSDANVLIIGETGAGKEAVAEMVHQYSSYSKGELVKVNLTALPATLMESELFGHEKGSFTGADRQRIGRFEMAHKGTIFLDEIGDMALSLQAKLLRVLQEREFERVGSSQTVKVDVRVVAATNKDLKAEVDAGRFREDLYQRLAVITIHVPPLRERKEDIPLLVEHFLQKHRFSDASAPARISDESLTRLISHDWPGNVRELEHTIERAVVLSRGGVITNHHLLMDEDREVAILDLNQKLTAGTRLTDVLTEVESRYISRALLRSDGNRHAAAKALGIDIAVLEKKLSEHGLEGRGERGVDVSRTK
ncbi:MAG: sigma-54-dependent Fis family transcriptional regulator [Chloroflexi bacterium]|nr:sigma-54-dependent Fis family transcriptional regulator [Chloroflexota bacterium]